MEFTLVELLYIRLAVERMAPLPHRPESTLNGEVLAKVNDLISAATPTAKA